MMSDLKAIIEKDEQIMYEGRPNKACFIFECIFNPMLPFALVWAIFDFTILSVAIDEIPDNLVFMLLSFFAFHLLPVWIYLGGVVLSIRKYKNTAYIVTDRAIYISDGAFSKSLTRKSFAELSNIHMHRGIFDQWFKVGDVIATSGQLTEKGRTAAAKICNISEYLEVYNLVKKLQTDIYTDVMYPNALRPDENPGYKTKYKG